MTPQKIRELSFLSALFLASLVAGNINIIYPE